MLEFDYATGTYITTLESEAVLAKAKAVATEIREELAAQKAAEQEAQDACRARLAKLKIDLKPVARRIYVEAAKEVETAKKDEAMTKIDHSKVELFDFSTAADQAMKAAYKNLGTTSLALTEKQEKISRFDQICNALKEAIAEAKENGAENEGGFSCDVIFDENGDVECAKVCFYEYFNYCIMHTKEYSADIVEVLYGSREITERGADFDQEVSFIASVVLDFYDAGEWRSGVCY